MKADLEVLDALASAVDPDGLPAGGGFGLVHGAFDAVGRADAQGLPSSQLLQCSSMDLFPRLRHEATLIRRGYVPLDPTSTTSGWLGVYLWAWIGMIATEYGRAALDAVPETVLVAALFGLVGIDWLAHQWAKAKAGERVGGTES